MDRSPGKVELEVEGRGRLSYSLILTIPFNSTRKRMSIIVQAPDGSYVLYCKVRYKEEHAANLCVCVAWKGINLACVRCCFFGAAFGGCGGGGDVVVGVLSWECALSPCVRAALSTSTEPFLINLVRALCVYQPRASVV